MRGRVDHGGRSLITVELRSAAGADATSLDVWIDTGLTGDLVLPRSIVDRLGLQESGSVDAILADGSQLELPTYTCVIQWFGFERSLEVIANDGEYPLLGVGLLLGLELRINYRNLKLSLAPVGK